MKVFFKGSQRDTPRWLSRLIISLAMAMIVLGVFWLGMFIGETRGGTPPVFGRAGIEHPWPFGNWPGREGHHGRHGTFGVVDRIGDETLVITAHDNTKRQIIIIAETTFKRHREQITLADIRAGDHIGVIGQPGIDEEIEVKVIWVIPDGQFNHN